MGIACAIPSPFPEFPRQLAGRMEMLAKESGQEEFFLPVGLFLVVDKENGGDATAEELIRRFKLLDAESRNAIDFYFAGWHPHGPGLRFSLADFMEFRDFLGTVGLREFGGNADLILVDAHYREASSPSLDFSRTIRVDLSASTKEEDFPSLGAFLQSIIQVANELKSDVASARRRGIVFAMSDKLGLAIAKTSMLDFILEKWGKIIGAKKLKHVAVRNLGPNVDLGRFIKPRFETA